MTSRDWLKASIGGVVAFAVVFVGIPLGFEVLRMLVQQ